MPADDDLIDAAPCPKCKAPLAVAAADLGYLIACPSCGTQSRAKRAESPKSPPPSATAAEPLPRKRNWDGDHEDEDDDRRPRGRDRSRDMDRHDRDDRRGARFRDDDLDDRPIRRPGQGAAVAAAVMNFIFAAVALVEGLCVGIGGSAALLEGRRGGGGPFGGPENTGLVFLGFGVCNLIGVGLMIPSGIGLLQRRDYGRTLGFLAAGLGLIYALAIVVLFLVILSEERGPPGAAVVVVVIPVLLWLAYAITNLILLGKVRPQSRR